MGVVSDFLDDGVVSPVGIIFNDVYCFPDKVIGARCFFHCFWSFFGR